MVYMHTNILTDVTDILLDIDGVLLDQSFDNKFWQEWVPQEVGLSKNISLDEAKREVQITSKALYGTLPWYELAYWEEKYQINLIDIADRNSNHAKFLPGSEATLKKLSASDKRIIFLTNCDSRLLKVKAKQVPFLHYADEWLSAVDIGIVKEEQDFWKNAFKKFKIVPEKSIFVDDNITIVNSALKAGISKSINVTMPSGDLSVRNKSNAELSCKNIEELFRAT